MQMEFKRLSEVDTSDVVELMPNPRLRAHMPLLSPDFDETACREFVAQKEQAWADHGYGVWAFFIDEPFAGWGGLQDENGDPDLGLVLHPDFWGVGKILYAEVVRRAFGSMGFDYITILLPPTRTKLAAVKRLGFHRAGEIDVGGESFMRFLLTRDRHRSRPEK